MKKILYILALSHTGSTVLSLELAKSFGGLAIGESYHVFRHSANNAEGVSNVCSCEMPLSECPFWSDVASAPVSDSEPAWLSSYEKILEHPLSKAAPFLVDSSKKTQLLPVLRELKKRGEADPFVIFLVRDVRGWVLSDRAAWQRKDGVTGARNKRFTLARHFYSWIRGNSYFERELRSSGLPFVTVGYEQFCFDREGVLQTIASRAGLSQNEIQGIHHVAYSNRMKMDGAKVIYDSRWMRSWKVNVLFSLMPWIWKKNAMWVFGDEARP
ncbi:MAG: hypothetical protein P4L81_01630 [Candidatus Pacebacteria bacterium]|nr:hypothetical protein [Candidatus Paceibacterota bacterium]